MSASVIWYQEDGHTYDIARLNLTTATWDIIASGETSPYTDLAGSITDKYHVRDTIGSPWGPVFYGVDTTANTCSVYGYVKLPDATPKEDSSIQIRARNEAQFYENASISFDDHVEVYTDVNGYWEKDLPIGAKLFIRIPDAHDWAEVVIPDLPTASFASLV